MTKPFQELHKEFLVAAEQPTGVAPSIDALLKQLLFVEEECIELLEALDWMQDRAREVVAGANLDKIIYSTYTGKEAFIQCLADIIDGMADVRYTSTGALTHLGIDEDTLMKDTHNNNMTKFVYDEKLGRAVAIKVDGKVVKPESYKPLDFSLYVCNTASYWNGLF